MPAPLATPSTCAYSAVLLDLDGTITDSAPVILRALRATLNDFGIEPPPLETLMTFIGPPLPEGLRALGGFEGEANAEAVACYRRHYRDHMLEAPVYDGVPELIGALYDAGTPLAVATSKRESLAALILEHLGLAHYLVTCSGADDLDRRSAKADVIRAALSRLEGAGVDTTRVVHVGDRRHDVEGAREAAVACIGVLWGYGGAEELAGAQHLAATPAELAVLLGTPLGPSPARGAYRSEGAENGVESAESAESAGNTEDPENTENRDCGQDNHYDNHQDDQEDA